MKIILLGLASRYTEGMTYQDNLLADQIKKDGNEVIVISDCYKYENGQEIKTEEEDKILSNGIRLIRLKYKNIMGEFVAGKIRAVKGLYGILETEKPDIIFQHALQSYELITVAKYKKNNPSVKLFVDSHEDFHNSATNFLSKNILHKIFYKFIIQKALPYIDKILCVTYESFDFLKELYDIPNDIMDFFPLGGIVLKERERIENRNQIRKELGLREQDILIVHSGKMDKQKRTEDLLKAFKKVSSDKLKLILIGSFSDEIKESVNNLVLSDNRITCLGWKKGDELLEYLSASDLYIQPGTQSATMQNALCCGSAAALYPYPSHKYLLKESVFYVKTENDIINVLNDILENPSRLENKRNETNRIAREILDYKVLASRLYNYEVRK